MKARRWAGLAVVVVGLMLVGPAWAGDVTLPHYRLAVIDEIPNSIYPGPTAINDRGEVLVGTALQSDKRMHSFLWFAPGKLVEVGAAVAKSLAGAPTAYGHGINNKGWIVGGYLAPNGKGEGHGFLWREGRVTDLGTLGGKVSEAWDVNDAGQVVGRAENAKGEMRAFVWEASRGMRDLRVPGRDPWAIRINEKGQIIGYTEGNTRSFLWDGGKVTILNPTPPEGFNAFKALSLNERGDIIGVFDRARGDLWHPRRPDCALP